MLAKQDVRTPFDVADTANQEKNMSNTTSVPNQVYFQRGPELLTETEVTLVGGGLDSWTKSTLYMAGVCGTYGALVGGLPGAVAGALIGAGIGSLGETIAPTKQ